MSRHQEIHVPLVQDRQKLAYSVFPAYPFFLVLPLLAHHHGEVGNDNAVFGLFILLGIHQFLQPFGLFRAIGIIVVQPGIYPMVLRLVLTAVQHHHHHVAQQAGTVNLPVLLREIRRIGACQVAACLVVALTTSNGTDDANSLTLVSMNEVNGISNLSM